MKSERGGFRLLRSMHRRFDWLGAVAAYLALGLRLHSRAAAQREAREEAAYWVLWGQS